MADEQQQPAEDTWPDLAIPPGKLHVLVITTTEEVWEVDAGETADEAWDNWHQGKRRAVRVSYPTPTEVTWESLT